MLRATTAQRKIASLNKRTRVVQGGTSASKTFSIIPLLITHAATYPNKEISIVAESVPHLKKGAIRDFTKIMQWTGNWIDERFNRTSLRYDFANGSFIEFFSADQPDKVRGARRDILFVNEANNIIFETYNQLAIRTRDFVYIDFNPTAEFWAHTELIGHDDVDFVVLTYKDNEALDQALVTEIEKAREKAKTSAYWDNWWKVYGLGQLGSMEGVVFSNWQTIDTIPQDARLIGYGLDFGFTNDPTAIIAVYQYDGQRIAHEVVYQKGMFNDDIARHIPERVSVWADSAEPKSIAELRRMGKTVQPVSKGADSITYGIDIMQRQRYLITKSSTNLIKEIRQYAWDKDKAGNTLNKPAGGQDHAIDALRYHEMMTLGKPARDWFVI